MAANRQNQTRPQGQPLAVREVRLDQVGRDGRTLKGRVTGKAARGDKPAEGINLFLLVGGVQTQNSPLQTNENGEASDDFAVPMEPEINRVLIEARIENGPSARKPIDIAAASSGPKKKVVDKVAVDASGDEGNYIVSVMVSAQDRTAIEGIDVIILDGTTSSPYRTDSAGSVLHKIRFTERSRRITIHVPGVEPQRLRLLGPKPGLGSPEAAARMSRREKFRRSNDYRLKVSWIATSIIFCFCLVASYMNGDNGAGSNVPKRPLVGYEILNQRLVDRGLIEQPQTQSVPAESFWNKAIHVTEHILWWAFAILLVVSVVYTPIAKREEMGYAFRQAWDKASSWKDLPDILTSETPGENRAAKPEPKTQRVLGWMNLFIFGREFLAAIFGDLLSGRRR